MHYVLYISSECNFLIYCIRFHLSFPFNVILQQLGDSAPHESTWLLKHTYCICTSLLHISVTVSECKRLSEISPRHNVEKLKAVDIWKGVFTCKHQKCVTVQCSPKSCRQWLVASFHKVIECPEWCYRRKAEGPCSIVNCWSMMPFILVSITISSSGSLVLIINCNCRDTARLHSSNHSRLSCLVLLSGFCLLLVHTCSLFTFA